MFDLSIKYFWAGISFLQAYNGAVTAVATIFIGVFTYVLALITRRQISLTKKSIDLAQAEFNATHRPEIIVHAVEVRHLMIPSGVSSDPPPESLGATVTYYNRGSTDAKIEEIRGRIYSLRLPIEPEKLPPNLSEIELPKTIESGIGDFFVVSSGIHMSSIGLMEEQRGIFCIGRIWYADMRGAHRQTGFIRRFDPTIRQWVRLENSSYEYAY